MVSHDFRLLQQVAKTIWVCDKKVTPGFSACSIPVRLLRCASPALSQLRLGVLAACSHLPACACSSHILRPRLQPPLRRSAPVLTPLCPLRAFADGDHLEGRHPVVQELSGQGHEGGEQELNCTTERTTAPHRLFLLCAQWLLYSLIMSAFSNQPLRVFTAFCVACVLVSQVSSCGSGLLCVSSSFGSVLGRSMACSVSIRPEAVCSFCVCGRLSVFSSGNQDRVCPRSVGELCGVAKRLSHPQRIFVHSSAQPRHHHTHRWSLPVMTAAAQCCAQTARSAGTRKSS